MAALLIAVLHDLVSNGQTDTSILTAWGSHKSVTPEQELRQLLEKAEKDPNPAIYVRLSECFERKGDFKKARLYLRKAEALSDIEE